MLKATAGGGGRGIRVITSPEELIDAYERTSQEAERAFGSGAVFLELDDSSALIPANQPKGLNKAGIVAGVATTPTERYPEGITRVGHREPGLGRGRAAPHHALHPGRRRDQRRGGVNVGAQAYWNAEATMLMHTRGILVMTPYSTMVLTGKRSLDFSGGVSAEDNVGIGGYDRVMGPNGQAQYWAPDLRAAHGVLLSRYDHSYVMPGEDAPRKAVTSDPIDRDISDYPHPDVGSDFTTVGQIFSRETNPERKKPFDIHTVMRALADQDHPILERWAGMADAETAVVQDVHLGGRCACWASSRGRCRGTGSRLPTARTPTQPARFSRTRRRRSRGQT